MQRDTSLIHLAQAAWMLRFAQFDAWQKRIGDLRTSEMMEHSTIRTSDYVT